MTGNNPTTASLSERLSAFLIEVKQLETEHKEWTTASANLERALQPFVKINIGGREFTTSLETLMKHKGSYFEKMLKGRHVEGTIVVDRNGSVFELVLDFMRGESLPLEHLAPHKIEQLKKDAQFYELPSLASLLTPSIPPACFSSQLKSPSIVYDGKDTVSIPTIGHAYVLGEQEYRTGVHEFVLQVRQVGNWLFVGIGSTLDTWTGYSYSLPHTYGWAGYQQVYSGGKDIAGFDSDIKTGDTIHLTLNCDAELKYYNSRTKATASLPIPKDIPWKLHLNLYNVGDCVQLINGPCK